MAGGAFAWLTATQGPGAAGVPARHPDKGELEDGLGLGAGGGRERGPPGTGIRRHRDASGRVTGEARMVGPATSHLSSHGTFSFSKEPWTKEQQSSLARTHAPGEEAQEGCRK